MISTTRITNKHGLRPSSSCPFTSRSQLVRSSSAESSASSSASSIDRSEMLTNTTTTETSSISTCASSNPEPAKPQENIRAERWQRMRKKAEEIWLDFLDALTETNEQIAEQQPNKLDRLDVRVLQRDIGRCLSESHAYLEIFAGVWDFLVWKNPLASLCAYCVLLWCVYTEWTISIVLGLTLLQLGFNFLALKNIHIGIHFLPRKEVELPKFDLSGVQLVFDIARRAQMLLTICADLLEKWKALFMWKEPRVTFHFVLYLSFFFWLSVLTSLNWYCVVVGALILNKAFIMNYLYYRFPRTRYMFDIAFYFYRKTPTLTREPPVEQQQNQRFAQPVPPSAKKRKFSLGKLFQSPRVGLAADTAHFSALIQQQDTTPCAPARLNAVTSSSRRGSVTEAVPPPSDAQSILTDSSDTTETADEHYNFEDVFKMSRTCTLIDKGDTFSRTLNGTLVLTEGALIFTSTNSKRLSPTIIELPLEAIVSCKKTKKLDPISRLKPGSNKGLEVASRERCLQFHGISKRDEFYDVIVQMAQISGVELDHDE